MRSSHLDESRAPSLAGQPFGQKMVQQTESKAGSGKHRRLDRRHWDGERDIEVVDDEVDDETVDVGVSVVAWRG
jgi:hypothetical protein